VIFYPRDIGMWRDFFDFTGSERPKIVFDSADELKTWCAHHGVDMNDPKFPFNMTDDGHVVQWTVIGYWGA
jgi:hypothetical protein